MILYLEVCGIQTGGMIYISVVIRNISIWVCIVNW